MRALCEPNEHSMHRVRCEQFSPLVSAKCDEDQGVMRENQPQARRHFCIFAHANLVAASLWEAQCRCGLAATLHIVALSKEAGDGLPLGVIVVNHHSVENQFAE